MAAKQCRLFVSWWSDRGQLGTDEFLGTFVCEQTERGQQRYHVLFDHAHLVAHHVRDLPAIATRLAQRLRGPVTIRGWNYQLVGDWTAPADAAALTAFGIVLPTV
jgi:hypothetical protein